MTKIRLKKAKVLIYKLSHDQQNGWIARAYRKSERRWLLDKRYGTTLSLLVVFENYLQIWATNRRYILICSSADREILKKEKGQIAKDESLDGNS